MDILVNNAGSTSNAGPLHEMTNKTWDETMDVFLRGVFRFSRSGVAPHGAWLLDARYLPPLRQQQIIERGVRVEGVERGHPATGPR